MTELVSLIHLALGLSLIALPIIILFEANKKRSSLIRPLSVITGAVSWILLIPAGNLYLSHYPATKAVIKAGSMPWVHSIVMETKEHWGLLIPIIATVCVGLVFQDKLEESKKWWKFLIVVAILMGIMGALITNTGAA